MLKRILITAGGTGGHVFPAQGLAQQLLKHSPDCEILFVAGGLAKNRYFDRSSFSFKEVPCSPLLSKNPLKSLKGCFHLATGFYQSLQVLREFNPEAVIGFGSYYTLSPLLAAKWLQIPIILHEGNSIPGKVNKWLASYADAVGVHFPYTISLLKGDVVEVGLPLREGYGASLYSQEEARGYFGLSPSERTLLVFGGSQGARFINQLMLGLMKRGWKGCSQVIHLTGDEAIVPELADAYALQGIKACVKPFEQEMDRAWGSADFFVGRAGAATMAEAMAFEVPGLLIPYPLATDNHQEKNADFLVHTVGGAVKQLESDLDPSKLCEILDHRLTERECKQLRQAMRDYKNRPSRIDLCQLVWQTIDKKRGVS